MTVQSDALGSVCAVEKDEDMPNKNDSSTRKDAAQQQTENNWVARAQLMG
jgi:hypothetical protein